MVFTRSKLNKLSKEQLIEKLLNFENWRFRYKIWSCFFCVADFQNLQFIITKQIADLERLSLDNSQYLRREMIEISPVPMEVSNELEGLVCKALSLTGNKVSLDYIEVCHHLKNKENVIVKFKSRKWKYEIINNRKIMKSKSKKFNKLKFSNNLYISESLYFGNHALFFKCQKLKKARKIFNTWFFSNAINVQFNRSGGKFKNFPYWRSWSAVEVRWLRFFPNEFVSNLEFIFITA